MRGLLTASLVVTICGLSHAQVVFRADFETEDRPGQPEGWVFQQVKGDCSGAWDDREAAVGTRSVRMSIAGGEDSVAHWHYQGRIPLKPSTRYRLTARIMVAEVEGEAYLIVYQNGGQDPQHWQITGRLRGTEDWREEVVEFRSRDDAEWLMMTAKLRFGAGHAWFDDITLEELPDAPEAPGPRLREFPPDDGFPLQAMWTPAQWCREDVLHLVRGGLNPLSVFFRGEREAVEAPALVVRATEGISVRGPVVRGRGPMPEDDQPQPRVEERDGRTWNVWRFPLPEDPLLRNLRDRYSWTEYYHLHADVAPDAPSEGELRWQLESGGALGPEHRLAVSVPPDIPGPLAPPDDFRIYVQHTGGLRHPDAEVRRRLIEFLNTAGIVGGLALTFYEPHLTDVDEQFRALDFDLHTWRFEGFSGSADEDSRLVDRAGERSPGRVCPQAQIERVQPWYDNLRAYYAEKLAGGVKRLIIDYEPPVGNICFCARCRAAFAARFDLDAAAVAALEPDDLLREHREQWGRFRAEQNGAIVKLHCEVIHEVDPEVAVGLCSWPGTRASAAAGADIAIFEPEAAFHAPMIYTHGTRFHDIVRETCEHTSAPVLPFIELHDISQPRSLTPAQLRMNLLATGLSGGGGAFMWVGIECFDAGYMAAIARSVREIAALREAVPDEGRAEAAARVTVTPVAETLRRVRVNGREVEMTSPNPAPHVRSHAWGTQRATLVALLNYDETRPYTMRVSLDVPPGAGYRVVDALSGETLAPAGGEAWSAEALRAGVPVDVPAEGLAAVGVTALQ